MKKNQKIEKINVNKFLAPFNEYPDILYQEKFMSLHISFYLTNFLKNCIILNYENFKMRGVI